LILTSNQDGHQAENRKKGPASNQDGHQAENRKKGDFQPRWLPSENRKKGFGGMILGWPPSKIVSGDPAFQPKWPPSRK